MRVRRINKRTLEVKDKNRKERYGSIVTFNCSDLIAASKDGKVVGVKLEIIQTLCNNSKFYKSLPS